jgi:hypothetical protein
MAIIGSNTVQLPKLPLILYGARVGVGVVVDVLVGVGIEKPIVLDMVRVQL